MDKFFSLDSYYALKHHEILVKFAEGVEHLNANYKEMEIRSYGLGKLCELKEEYEKQLAEVQARRACDDVVVCFRCFATKEGPCTDC